MSNKKTESSGIYEDWLETYGNTINKYEVMLMIKTLRKTGSDDDEIKKFVGNLIKRRNNA